MQDSSLDGEVVGFGFRSPDGAFAVARVRNAEGAEITAVGALAHLVEGQRVRATGQWVHDARFGRQFKVGGILIEEPRTLAGIERYLRATLDGVGPELARRIVEAFGTETLAVLDHDDPRLREVPGVGDKVAARIRASWSQGAAGRELLVTLGAWGLGPAVCRRVVERFGRDAGDIVRRFPYRLTEVRGIGFRTADQVARAGGVEATDPTRIAAAVGFVLEQAEEEGSCFLPEDVLVTRLGALDVPGAAAVPQLDLLAGLGRIARHRAPAGVSRAVYRPEMDRLESVVARALVARARPVEPIADAVLDAAQSAVGLELHGAQRDAVRMAVGGGLAVITGGPGTGKTTLVRVLLAAAKRRGEAWACAAPTGRAARRLAESTGTEARTLHRLLEYSMQEMRFTRDADKPLDVDAVLVDEASMVDLRLMGALLAALPSRARLVLVGDVDQLPSVGAGQVLRDVIASGSVPVSRLTEVYRQAAQSGIVRNAHRVNRGEPPVSSEREEGCARDFFVLGRPTPEAALATLLQVVRERLPALGLDPLRDVQVLTPMHRGPLGTVALNAALGAALNPDGAALVVGGRTFRVGDRVIQTRNDYDLDVFNGDVGRVVSIDGGALTVDVDGRPVVLSPEAAESLELGWAISIHKSQGSEYPAVLVVLHDSHYVMLRRHLVYTALTRAQRFACIVASPRALRDAVARAGGDARHTGLAGRMRVLTGEGPAP